MKSKGINKKKAFEKEYKELMRDFKNHNNPCFQYPQWKDPKDFIVKFSLLQETPNSITSTDTSVIL
jgi:hypothetical protein